MEDFFLSEYASLMNNLHIYVCECQSHLKILLSLLHQEQRERVPMTVTPSNQPVLYALVTEFTAPLPLTIALSNNTITHLGYPTALTVVRLSIVKMKQIYLSSFLCHIHWSQGLAVELFTPTSPYQTKSVTNL